MRRRSFAALLSTVALVMAPMSARAASALYSLAIGHNGRPPEQHGAGAVDLHFADDDALAVHELVRTIARRSIVLTLPDRATQARYPSNEQARPPTITELRRALAELRAEIERATRAGDEVTVWFFYSGHGWLDENGRANLSLADGPLSQSMLYDEILAALAARTIHLMIDACHAEAMIRSRDLTAETIDVSPSQVAIASLRSHLHDLSHVGVVMASASNTQAHEWDDYQSGVFTHELLSGLRGGADVNGDGRIEYSEIAAFLTAANRGVTDPRARLTTLVVPPKLYPRAAILDLRNAQQLARLSGGAHHLGRFQIDDERGNRLLDLRIEPGFAVTVVVPADERLLLSNDRAEETMVTSANSVTSLESLALTAPRTRARGALSEQLRRGLFAADFGPSYYRGYVDNSDNQILPVDFAPPGVAALAAPETPSKRRQTAAWSAFLVSGVSLAIAGACGIGALNAYGDFQDTNLERPSRDARERYVGYGTVALGTAALGTVAAGLGYLLWDRGRAR